MLANCTGTASTLEGGWPAQKSSRQRSLRVLLCPKTLYPCDIRSRKRRLYVFQDPGTLVSRAVVSGMLLCCFHVMSGPGNVGFTFVKLFVVCQAVSCCVKSCQALSILEKLCQIQSRLVKFSRDASNSVKLLYTSSNSAKLCQNFQRVVKVCRISPSGVKFCRVQSSPVILCKAVSNFVIVVKVGQMLSHLVKLRQKRRRELCRPLSKAQSNVVKFSQVLSNFVKTAANSRQS